MKNTVLAQAREQAGYTQEDIARHAGISRPSYQRYELGKRLPNVQIANRIAKALHSTAEELFGT